MKLKDVVLLSTAEWDNPFWTNKQHVAIELAKRGHRVFYIDSLGLRRPSISNQDTKRIIKRIRKAFQKPKKVKENLWVWSPVLLPFQNNTWTRKFNYYLLSNWLRTCLKRLNFNQDIFWTYNPLTLNLFDTDLYSQLIYHCVDEIKAQPGMPVKLIEDAEKKLATKANLVFATSTTLYESRKLWNEKTYYFSNVADFDHFSKAREKSTIVPDDLLKIPHPRLGFIGALSGYKVDFKLLEFLAQKHPEYSIVLLGKVGEGDPWTNIDNLYQYSNIFFLGSKSYSDLPSYLKGFDLAMLPNAINEYTNSMFPMKFFEYLSAGKPIVSINLHALQEYKEVCFLSNNHEEFINNIENALKNIDFKLKERLALAKGFTYKSRTDEMMKLIQNHI